jgi:hypothetical protein
MRTGGLLPNSSGSLGKPRFLRLKYPRRCRNTERVHGAPAVSTALSLVQVCEQSCTLIFFLSSAHGFREHGLGGRPGRLRWWGHDRKRHLDGYRLGHFRQSFLRDARSGSGRHGPCLGEDRHRVQFFTVSGTQTVRFGSGSSWVTKQVTGSGKCNKTFFGSDPHTASSRNAMWRPTLPAPAPARVLAQAQAQAQYRHRQARVRRR